MNTPSVPAFLALLEANDVRVSVEDGRLKFSAGPGALTPVLREALQDRRDEILRHLQSDGVLPTPQLTAVDRTGDFRLSSAQERLWFLSRYEPGGSTYNIPALFRLRGTLQVRALETALAGLVDRHESLRTILPEHDGRALQRILQCVPVQLPLVSVEHSPDPEHAAQQHIKHDALLPFNLDSGPLIRTSLVRLSATEHLLLVVVHHIVCDGWSLGVLCRELGALYEAALFNRAPALAPLKIQYADYAGWQHEQLGSPALTRQLAYWTRTLDGSLPVLQLPTDRPRPAVQTFRGHNASALLPARLKHALTELSRQEHATLFMTLLAAFNALLYRYTGQEDLAVGSPIANRTREDTEGLIGFFVNTLVLRTSLHGDPTFQELIARVRNVAIGAYEHQDLPFEKLVEELRPERNVSGSPLFQVLFVLQNAPLQPLTLSGLEPASLEYPGGTAKFELTLFTEDVPDGLLVTAEYNTDLFDEETIRRLIGHYRQILEAVAADPGQPVSTLPLLSSAEKRRILLDWNETAQPLDSDQSVHRLVEAQVNRTPTAVAVEFGLASLTYTELNARANQLARRLRSLGVGPEIRTGICLPRSVDMVVAVLAVLKAGGAYVPLDPAYPSQRLAFMLDDAEVSVLVTNGTLAGVLPAHKAVTIDLPASRTTLATESSEDLAPSSGPDSLMYVTYTSGSTGKPKGIAMIQRPLLNLLAWMCRTTSLPSPARTLQFASLSFDVSFQDIFSTWVTGGTLVMISDAERKDLRGLARLLCSRGVHRLFIPAVALQQLAEGFREDPALMAPLRKVIAGSEQLIVTDALADMFGRMPECSLHNEYGPSETHVVTELTLPRSPAEWPARPPIGRPIDNTQIYLLDRALQPVPAGVPGEVHIGGAGLARGYLGREELTAERFIKDPWSDDGRLYKTGDLARHLPDGAIEFLGRIDHQTKIRGYRVEPGEIEAALEENPVVKEAVVIASMYAPGDSRLVAYVVSAAGLTPSVSELRAFLSERLPEYMVPSAFVMLEVLPLTPNGKVDRRALPLPDTSRPALAVTFAEPQSQTERAIAELWSEALQVDRVGLHDNFFDLGGHSLLIVRIQSRLRDKLQRDVSILDLFKYPTVHALAAHLTRPVAATFGDVRDRARRQRESQFAAVARGTRPGTGNR